VYPVPGDDDDDDDGWEYKKANIPGFQKRNGISIGATNILQ
jgi:hypothetical protein